jgi:hypothetical protein
MYYWRIDATNSIGTTPGPRWSFYVKEGINAGQIAYWKLDETEGSTAADSGPFKLDGEILNMDPATWYPGKVNGGLLFDGIDDVMQVPHEDVLILSDESFSISAWIYTEALPGHPMVLFQKGTSSGDGETGNSGKWLGMDIREDTVRFAMDDMIRESLVTLPGAGILLPFSWTHLVAVRNAEDRTLALYVNGELTSSAPDETGSLSQEEDLYFGNNPSGTGPFYGILDEISMYNYALRNSEVKALYALATHTPEGRSNEFSPVQVYPNPFRSSITLTCPVASESPVLLSIYTATGRIVKTLVNQPQAKGRYHFTLDGSDLEPGIYLYELKAGPAVYRGRIIRMK